MVSPDSLSLGGVLLVSGRDLTPPHKRDGHPSPWDAEPLVCLSQWSFIPVFYFILVWIYHEPMLHYQESRLVQSYFLFTITQCFSTRVLPRWPTVLCGYGQASRCRVASSPTDTATLTGPLERTRLDIEWTRGTALCSGELCGLACLG